MSGFIRLWRSRPRTAAIAVLGAALSLGLPRVVFYQPAVLIAFFAVLITTSVATYRGFELPAHRWLRTRLLGTTRCAAAVRALARGEVAA